MENTEITTLNMSVIDKLINMKHRNAVLITGIDRDITLWNDNYSKKIIYPVKY